MPVLQDSVNYMKKRASSTVSIKLDASSETITADINIELFEWVIENLVKNAVDAIKGKGEIIISINENNTNVIINIKDNGEGINQTILKNIFKPGVTSKKRGWGLGLSLSKRIIEQYHKGNIFVMQSEKGVGSTFTIELPKNLNKI